MNEEAFPMALSMFWQGWADLRPRAASKPPAVLHALEIQQSY